MTYKQTYKTSNAWCNCSLTSAHSVPQQQAPASFPPSLSQNVSVKQISFSRNPPIQSPAKVASAGAGCTGWCPGECWVFPETETAQPLWAACCSAQSPSQVKTFSLIFGWNFLCSSLCPLPLVLSLGTAGKSLASSSWRNPFAVFVRIGKIPSHFFPRLKRPSSLSLS